MQKSQAILASSPFGIDSYPSAPPAAPSILLQGDTLPGYSKRASTSPGVSNELSSVESSESLYQASAWAKLWFLRLMILTVTRLMLFLRKIYEDYSSTTLYMTNPKFFGQFLISFSTLFLPTIIFTTYRVARYLQVQVFPRSRTPQSVNYQQRTGQLEAIAHSTRDQLRLQGRSTPFTSIDDGLVTARESPNLDDCSLHESSLQQQVATRELSLLTPSTVHNNTTNWFNQSSPELANQSQQKTRHRPIVFGIGEQFLHGILYVFWQLKRQVDVIGFLVERACLWRKARQDEQVQLQKLQLGSDGLEWFQDFYAAFLAILVQVYTLGLQWAPSAAANQPVVNSNATLPSGSVPPNEPSSKNGIGAVSKASQKDSNGNIDHILRVAGHHLDSSVAREDLVFISQLIVSSAIVVSLLMAVRRRDDGPLTLFLSMVGWGALFTSRVIVLALAVVNLGSFVMFIFTSCHILFITAWIYKIALDSHNNKPGESEEFEWDDDENDRKLAPAVSPEPTSTIAHDCNTENWSLIERFILLVQVLILFAIPSVFYWPIMFNLKLHYRPFKYLVLVISQNFTLIAIVLLINGNTTELYLLAGAAALTIIGFLFISLYHCCKPSLTEYFARADELFNEAERSGVYFEFCSRVFKMPDLSKHSFKRLMNQRTEIVERDS